MELDSPLPTPTKFLSRSRRQFPDNGPPDRNPPTTSIPSTSSMVASGTAVVSYSGVNTASLFWDPSASGSVDPKSVVVTASASEVDDSPTSVSTADKLFTPKGKLFAVGIVIIGFGVLTLLTCIIVLTRCTLRRRRRERTLALARQRAQSQSQSPSPSKLASEKKRKISADRASEFWSADASRRTRSTYEIDGERRPARPERTGEAESDLRETGPGRVHFTPSVTMSDYTALSMDVQGGSARASAASAGPPGNVAVATSGASVDPLAANSLVVSKPPASKHFSSATRMTLDADPFACTPVATPLTAKPFLAHSNTFPPYVPGSPHTTNFEPQYTPGLSSSPSNMGPSTSTVALSEMTSIGPALSSSNLNHFPSPPVNSLGLEPRPPMHRSSTGMDSMMSGSVVDPFAFDRMAHTSLSPSNPYASIGAPAPLYIAPTSAGIQTVPSPSPYSPSPSQAGSMAFPPAAYASPAFLSATLPQTGMVESGQSYFALTTSPQHSSPLQQSPSAYSPPQQSYISSSPPQQSYLSTPPQPSVLSMTPPQAPAHLQTDVSQALRNLRRRMSDSTVMSSGTGNTTEYRPTLRALDESPQRSEFFVPSSPRSPRHSVPLFSTGPEASQGGAPVYPSPTSEIDTYYRPR